jgi:ferric-dicitrate binding protein FerR (iron transport regulator)
MTNFNSLEHYLNDDSFVRWIIGKADAEEFQRWENWEKLDTAHSELAAEAKIIIKKLTANEPKYPNPKAELGHLHHLIDRYEEEKELWSFKRYEKRRTPVYIGIAASIAILAALIYFYSSFTGGQSRTKDENKVASVQEFQTDYGQKSTLSLSDGSRIILNANSNLKFTSNPNQNANIDIWLNGEAYFSIPHFTGLRKRVVRIHTQDGIITDLGTKFSVNSRSGKTLVALVEGHVRVKSNTDSSKSSGSGYFLNPNDLAILHKGKKEVQVSHVSASIYTS